MDNQEAIEILKIERAHMTPTLFTERIEAMDMAISALQEKELSLTQKTLDIISRQAAIDAIVAWAKDTNEMPDGDDCIMIIGDLPSAQPTIHGYNIEHLELIARVLQKEDLPPERIVEALTDIGRIVAIVKDEFEEALRKAVEQCTM